MRKLMLAGVAVLGALSLAACGDTRGERALTGAGLGGGTGAVLGVLTGGSIVAGAAIGAAAGAVAGALTDKNDVNLGKPAWK